MQEASFSEVIEVLLIILLVYFGFKIFVRWFGPIILKYFLKKIGKKVQNQFNQFDASGNRKKSGEVIIEKKPKSGKKSNKEMGEYIDYEEID